MTNKQRGDDPVPKGSELCPPVGKYKMTRGHARRTARRQEKRTGKLELVKIDIDAEHALAARFGIQSIPTVAVFRDGEPVTGFVGAYPPATIGKFLDELLAKEAEAAAA